MNLSYINRANQPLIADSLQSPFVTAVLGPRRVGKSTLLNHLTEQLPPSHKVFLNMDSRDERDAVLQLGLQALIEERLLKKLVSDDLVWVVIDEAQKCPELFEQVKIIYDEFKGQGAIKFLLTGSGSLNLHKLSAESLAGRIQIFHLREFNLREICALQVQKTLPKISILDDLLFKNHCEDLALTIDKLRPFCSILGDALKVQLIFGGLPEVIELQTKEERVQYLSNYLQTYLEKDILIVQTVSDLQVYQNLMTVIAEQTGSVRSDQKIIDSLTIARETVSKYRRLLSATLMYEEVYPFISNALKRLIKSPKGYLTNNGLISYLTNLYDIEVLETTGIIGHRFENWFLKELQVVLDREPSRSEINYWRTSSGAEVDFIVNMQTYIVPFEIAYKDNIDRKKIKNLKVFLKEEVKAKFGVLVYNGEFQYDQENKIIYLPAWAVG